MNFKTLRFVWQFSRWRLWVFLSCAAFLSFCSCFLRTWKSRFSNALRKEPCLSYSTRYIIWTRRSISSCTFSSRRPSAQCSVHSLTGRVRLRVQLVQFQWHRPIRPFFQKKTEYLYYYEITIQNIIVMKRFVYFYSYITVVTLSYTTRHIRLSHSHFSTLC